MARYKKGRFVKPGLKRRYGNVSAAMQTRFDRQDHSYASTDSCNKPNLSHVVDDIVVNEDGAQIINCNNWRDGRRVVELGILADALSACKFCGNPLQLTHTSSIQTYGLSAILKVGFNYSGVEIILRFITVYYLRYLQQLEQVNTSKLYATD